MFALSVVTVLVGVLSVYGIRTFLLPKAEGPTTSVITFPPLELKLELNKTEFDFGEPIYLKVTLRNISNETITLNFSFREGRTGFKVFNANGTPFFDTPPFPFPLGPDIFSMEPNQQISRGYAWHQMSNILSTNYYGRQVPDGTYTIIGKTSSPFTVGSTVVNSLETPPITIRILPKPATPIISVITSPPLELSLGLEKTGFEQGELIKIIVSLKNVGDTSINITFCNKAGRTLYEVYDANGTKIDGFWALPAAVDRLTLEPGEEVSQIHTWGQICRNYMLPYDGKQVPKGTYTIVGFTVKFALGDEISLREPLETPPITITIK